MTALVTIIDYGSGNLRSAAKAFERMVAEHELDAAIRVTDDPELVRRADRIVLPGVGAFADCRAGLAAVPGMEAALDEAVIRGGRPFFGICVGMQLMATVGREYGETPGLGWIEGAVVPIAPTDPGAKIPHMGWNTLRAAADHPLFAGLDWSGEGPHAYFVHSFHLQAERAQDVAADTRYGGADDTPMTAVVARDTLFGTQFHPEKSQSTGLTMIGNFLCWAP